MINDNRLFRGEIDILSAEGGLLTMTKEKQFSVSPWAAGLN